MKLKLFVSLLFMLCVANISSAGIVWYYNAGIGGCQSVCSHELRDKDMVKTGKWLNKYYALCVSYSTTSSAGGRAGYNWQKSSFVDYCYFENNGTTSRSYYYCACTDNIGNDHVPNVIGQHFYK